MTVPVEVKPDENGLVSYAWFNHINYITWQKMDWYQRRNYYMAFAIAYGRLPHNLPGGTDEQWMTQWLDEQPINGITLDQEELLKDLVDFTHWIDMDWYQRRDHFIKFVNENMRSPYKRSSSSKERAMANWLSKQRRIVKGTANIGSLLEDQVHLLHELEELVDWDHSEWRERQVIFANFVKNHHRFPRRRTSCVKERKMANWFYKQELIERRPRESGARAARLTDDKKVLLQELRDLLA